MINHLRGFSTLVILLIAALVVAGVTVFAHTQKSNKIDPSIDDGAHSIAATTTFKTSNGFTLTLPTGWSVRAGSRGTDQQATIYNGDDEEVGQINCPSAEKAEFFQEQPHRQEHRTFMSGGNTIQVRYDDFVKEGTNEIVEADVYLAPQGLTYELMGKGDARAARTCRITGYPSSDSAVTDVVDGMQLIYRSAQ